MEKLELNLGNICPILKELDGLKNISHERDYLRYVVPNSLDSDKKLKISMSLFELEDMGVIKIIEKLPEQYDTLETKKDDMVYIIALESKFDTFYKRNCTTPAIDNKKKDKIKICIDLRGLIFLKEKPQKAETVSDKKLEILKFLSNKKPKTIFEIRDEVDYTEERRVSTAIKEINDTVKDKFKQESNLIISAGKGYCFNISIFSISFIK